jgi:hypothetical protein
MLRHLSSVFFGGVEVDALALRQALKLGNYRFNFHTERQELALSSDKGEIMRITCAYESARKFVTEFGCKHASDTCITWAISISEPILRSDLSQDADVLETALRRSGLPYRIVYGSPELTLVIRSGEYRLKGGHKIADLLGMIQGDAQTYADVIELWKT